MSPFDQRNFLGGQRYAGAPNLVGELPPLQLFIAVGVAVVLKRQKQRMGGHHAEHRLLARMVNHRVAVVVD
jgi:hypothetical protein